MSHNAAYIGFVYTSLSLKDHRDGWLQRGGGWMGGVRRGGQRRGSWLRLWAEGPGWVGREKSFSPLINMGWVRWYWWSGASVNFSIIALGNLKKKRTVALIKFQAII